DRLQPVVLRRSWALSFAERKWSARWRHHLEGIYGHRDKRIVAEDADQIDEAALTERAKTAGVEFIGKTPIPGDGGGNVIDGLLLSIGKVRGLPVADRLDGVFRQPRIERMIAMGKPFEFRSPMARGYQDGKL